MVPSCPGENSACYSDPGISTSARPLYKQQLGRRVAIPIRVLVVDDSEIVRMGVRVLLYDAAQWEICGEAENGADAITKVSELSPDIVVLDLIMPVMSGFETAARIRKIAPTTKIVFFSVHDTPTTARLVGADAFVSKASAAKELARAITGTLELGLNRTRTPDDSPDQKTN